MKTAISLPDKIYFEAEATAQNLGISRSALYLKALTEYMKKINNENITQKLNEVYEKIDKNEFARDLDIGIESLRELTKNDTW